MDDRIRGTRPMPLDARGPLLGDAMAQYRDWGITHLEHVFSSDEWQALKEFAEARFAEVKDSTRSHERQIRLVRPHATEAV